MKQTLRFTVILLLAAGCLLQSGLRADDKKAKEPEKKKPAEDVVVNDSLINADLKDKVHTQSFCKSYTMKLEKGKSYQLELSSTAFAPTIRLENLAGAQVAAPINQFGGQRVVLLYDPQKTEDHQIIVTSPNGGAMGKFKLVVKDASAYSVLNVSSKLDQNDKQYAGAGNKKHKLFLVELEKGKTYQIDMTSGAFDSYLYLESPGSKHITQDDDGGGYPSARIIHTATETGKYRVIATYFSGGIGDFNLSARQTDGAGPDVNPKRFLDKK